MTLRPNADGRGAAASLAGTVRTSAGAVTPLGAGSVEITGGLLRAWRDRNREATVPHVLDRLRAAGNVSNLERLVTGDDRPYRGRYPFLDTDLYKTLEGLVYDLAAQDRGGPAVPEGVREFYGEVVGLLERAQAEDGYLGSYFQGRGAPKKPWEDLLWGHEMYNLGHLVQAAVAANRQLGDGRLLAVARRFADLVVRRYGEDGEEAVCGHPEVETALVELYRETGESAYLTQARLFTDRRGRGLLGAGRAEGALLPPAYYQDEVPLRELPSVTGHAVRMGYLAAGAADVAVETGDRELLAALVRLWDDMAATKLYLTGGLGSRHSDEAIGDRYELPSERSYSETCAAIAVMQWAWRMFTATGAAGYLDVFELVLYNAFAVGLSAEGTAFFYDNPLQRRPDHDQRSGAEAGGEPLRRSWFGCPCCPPNVVRWMAQLQDHMAAERDGALYLAQYADARIATAAVALTTSTGYPWDGAVRITVERAPEGPFALVARVPGWAHGAHATVNGERVAARPRDGWLTLERRWSPGDEVLLTLPMPVRAHGSHPHLDATRGAVAVARGPLVYCLEQHDCPVPVDDVVLPPERVADAVAAPREIVPDAAPGSVAVRLTGRAAPPPPAVLYPELPLTAAAAAAVAADPGADVPLTLVPYFLWGNRGPAAMRVWLAATR